jgi:hypothetical protein
MGMDVTYGTIWGVPMHEIADDLPPVTKYETVYDRHTGVKSEQAYIVHQSKLLVDLGEWKTGDVVDDDTISEYMANKQHIYRNYDDPADEERLYYSPYVYIGFKSFAGLPPYLYPQNSYREYKDTSMDAKTLWDRVFPGIPGRNLIFLYVSV